MPQDHRCLRIAGEQASVLLDAAWNMDRLPIAIGQIDGFVQGHGRALLVDAGQAWFGVLRGGPESTATNLRQIILGVLLATATREAHPTGFHAAGKPH